MAPDSVTDKLDAGLLTNANPAYLEAYNTVRVKLVLSLKQDGCKRILVTSLPPQTGMSEVAPMLAVVLSKQIDVRVLLIDCNLREPKLQSFFRVEQSPGLTDCLHAGAVITEAVREHTERLHVIPAGTIPANPSELLLGSSFGRLLEHLQQSYDYIVMDTPPVGAVSDALLLARGCDGVILTVRQRKTHHDELEKTVEMFRRLQIHLLGFIIE